MRKKANLLQKKIAIKMDKRLNDKIELIFI